jgi:hypothetical protein
MFKLKFSEQINEDIISSITYIKETLGAPMVAQKHLNELIKKYKLFLYRFLHSKRDWIGILGLPLSRS